MTFSPHPPPMSILEPLQVASPPERPVTLRPETTDAILQRLIQNLLARRLAENSARVWVTVWQGTVTLGGRVDSLLERAEAECAALVAVGSRPIVNEIEVVAAGPCNLDDQLRARVHAVLTGGRITAGETIQVGVQGGVVTLRGAVECPFERRIAARAVWALPGIHGVINELTVTGTARAMWSAVRASVEAQVAAQGDVAHLGVEVRQGEVTLSGQVGTVAQRDRLGHMILNVPGVRTVENRLHVGGPRHGGAAVPPALQPSRGSSGDSREASDVDAGRTGGQWRFSRAVRVA